MNNWADNKELVQLRIESVEQRMLKFEELFERQVRHEAQVNERRDVTLDELLYAQQRTTETLAQLIVTLKEPLEDFNTRKYGMKFIHVSLAQMKVYGLILAGVIALWLFTNPALLIKVLALLG